MFGTVGTAGQGFSFIGEVNLTGRRLRELPGFRNAGAVRRLMLSHNQLTRLDLAQFPSLEWVDCKGNQLTTLDNLPSQLMYLTLQSNRLTSLTLPPWNERLELIDVSHNALTTDAGLVSARAPKLRSLNVAHNQLAHWTAFQPSLEVISLEHNLLQDLPDAPPRLKELLAGHNRLTSVPPSYASCEAQKLDFRANDIRTMPDCAAFEVVTEGCPLQAVFAFRHGTVINLQNVRLSNAALDLSAYSMVIHLTLEGMDLTSLPSNIGRLSQLKVLNVENNPRLAALPETLGGCLELQELYVRRTAITRLPASLRECAGMTHIECDEALRAQATQFLREAEAARRVIPVAQPTTAWDTASPVSSSVGSGGSILQRWCSMANRPHPNLAAFTDQQQAMLVEWLQRLQATNDFSWNKQHLCNVVLDCLPKLRATWSAAATAQPCL